MVEGTSRPEKLGRFPYTQGEQYEVFLFGQQGEPEHCLGKAWEVRHVVAGTPSLVGGGVRGGLEPGQWTDIPELSWER